MGQPLCQPDKSHLTRHLCSQCLLHPTRRQSRLPLRQQSPRCRFPQPTGSIQTPRLGTCRCRRAAACRSHASWCSSRCTSKKGEEETVRVQRCAHRSPSRDNQQVQTYSEPVSQGKNDLLSEFISNPVFSMRCLVLYLYIVVLIVGLRRWLSG